MKLVDCDPIYWEFVRILRNDPKVSDGFIQTNFITPQQQIDYMNNHSMFYRICLLDGVPVGYIGVIDNDIRVCTHPEFQKKGVAEFMVNELMKSYPGAFAKIKVDNIASRRLFEKCGFKLKYYLYDKD